MTDHTPVLSDAPATNGEAPAAVPGNDTPPRQPLADQTPFLSNSHFEARQAADQVLCESHPSSCVAYVDNWVGDRLERLVVVAAQEPIAFQAALARLDPSVRRRCEVTRTPDPDAFEIPGSVLN